MAIASASAVSSGLGTAGSFKSVLVISWALLSTGYDSAAVRTARYAVDNLLPVVGGEVANTMDALVSSVLLVKNAAGAVGK